MAPPDPSPTIAVDLVILTVRDESLHVLLVRREEPPFADAWALPGGIIDVHEDLGDAAQRVLAEEASLGGHRIYLEQVRTFGAPDRDPRGRVVSVAFVALGAGLPDPQSGKGVVDARWWPVHSTPDAEGADGIDLAFDHAEVLARSVERARSKLEYSTLATTLLPEEFTISQLRHVYEQVWGRALDAGNFHRKATNTPGFLVDLGRYAAPTGGRPARLYRAGDGTRLNPPLMRAGS